MSDSTQEGQSLDALRCVLIGTSLIEASAGTGKTHAITTLFVRLLLERKLPVEEILVVTYTRAATAELRDRIRKRLRAALLVTEESDRGHAGENSGESTKDPAEPPDPEMFALAAERATHGATEEDRKRLHEALRNFDKAAIFTIHGFCQRILQDSAFESGTEFDTDFIGDESELVAEIVNDFWACEMYGAKPALVRFLVGAKPAINPGVLAKLARRVTQNPSMPVVPQVDEEATAAVIENWTQVQASAAALWAAEREVIVALLDGNDSLKKNQYKPGNASGPWAKSMDQCLSEQQMGIPSDFKAFLKFTDEGIRKALRKYCEQPEHEFFGLCEQLARASSELSVVSLAMNQKLVDYARTELSARKESLAVQSYDDLLLRLVKALQEKGGHRLAEAIRTRFPGALIDEFQDTDPMQYEIFQRVYAPPATAISLFLIGDPKQAIYAFRGADVFAYMEARRHAGENRHTMSTNWRSDPKLVRAVNLIFKGAKQSFVFDAIDFAPVDPRPGAIDRLHGGADAAALQVLYVTSEGRVGRDGTILKGWADRHLPGVTARGIADLLASGATIAGAPSESADGTKTTVAPVPVRPGDIAVLVRKNYQASAVQEALRDLGIPSVVESDSSVFESHEAVEVERVLHAMVNPSHARALVAALTTNVLGVNGDEMHALRSEDVGWEQWLDKFRRWHQRWEDSGFIQAYRQMLSEEGVPQRLLSCPGGERQLTNLYHLGELLQAESSASRLGGAALVLWMKRMRKDPVARSQEVGDTSALRLENDADAVKLVTIHKSKGLEYPIVYCPYLWDGTLLSKRDRDAVRFHDPDNNDQLVLDIGSEELPAHRKLAEREAMAENLRLLYVALTRAKHQCHLVWGRFTGSETSPLAYLWHQDSDADASIAGLEAMATRTKELDDEERMADLAALSAASEGAISLRVWSERAAPQLVLPTDDSEVLQARAAGRYLRPLGRFSSFSALVSGGSSEGLERDVDQGAASVVPQVPEPPAGQAGEGALTLPLEIMLAEFPRGARVGVMMHEVFEHTDFSDKSGESLARASEEAFSRYGIGEDPEERFLPAMRAALATPLLSKPVPGAPRLCDIQSTSRLDELEFLFPAGTEGGALRAKDIAALLAARKDAPWPASYPSELAKIDFVPLKGYLRGFVDLIFREGERWYVADYKSNFLGPLVSDYSPQSMALSMAGHHYFLQYLVYTVALHRYLQYRLPDYNYEKHMGGVLYLFVRGMGPANPKGSGVFADRIPYSLVKSLSSLFSGGTEVSEVTP